MRNKLAILFIASLFLTCQARADFYSGLDGSDFDGEAYFSSPSPAQAQSDSESDGETKKHNHSKHSTPPIKLLRLKLQEMYNNKTQGASMYAPTSDTPSAYKGEVETSEYASHELKEEFENMAPDGFEADEQAFEETTKKSFFKRMKKNSDSENKEDVILDCDTIDYDTPNYLIYARGNVSVEFVKQNATVKADVITFDRANNTIKAEGNVKIIKLGRVVTGDYIFVDLNEENALIENPLTEAPNITMKAKRGYVYSDKIVQEQGSIKVDGNYPIEFHSNNNGASTRGMLMPKNQSLTNDMEKGIIKFTAKDIKVTQKGDLETIAIKRGKLSKGSRTIFKVPAVKIYTNKNHEYLESNIWEIGAYRGLGVYTGPGWVFELPKGSVLKAMPILNYKSGIGVGALGRFSSGTNNTIAAYGSAASKVIVYGKQKLDDDLFLQYGVNGYMDEWFLGKRRPKYGVSLVYNKGYSSRDFILKDRTSSFKHRLEAGYFQDLDFDRHFENIQGGRNIGTPRFRYMAEANQNFFEYQNPEKLTAFTLGVSSQLSASLYGTGDTQVIGRLGPRIHTQYKRWMQDIGYYFSAYDDNTPMPMFDAYRYGKQNLYMREYFRICRWLTVSWLGSFNLSNDSPNHKSIQGNAFYISVGPDDLKFNIGYDFVRQNLRCTVDVMMDAKGAKVEYDKLEIKQTKKPAKEKEPVVAKKTPANTAPTAPKVLKKAIVEDVKVMEEVL